MGKKQQVPIVNVAVVNAHPAECKGLGTLLAEGGYQVVLQVPQGEALLDALAQGVAVDLVLQEVGAHLPNAYTTMERLCAEHPRCACWPLPTRRPIPT
ncbi:MAG: hypothetical protein IPN38_13565 [Flavobacteriales bacterium]|nr:hypothetical protein [Flavobacteriales bacterium]